VDINTQTVQRLREALLAAGRLDPGQPGQAPGEQGSAHRQASINRFSPFAETLYLMMVIDDHTSDDELDAIRGAMHILTNGELGDSVLEDIFQRCAHRASEIGVENCLQGIGARLASDRLDRETAFSLAAAVALADGSLKDEESALMADIAEWFGISNKRAGELLSQA